MHSRRRIFLMLILVGLIVPVLHLERVKAKNYVITVSATQVRLGDFFLVRCPLGNDVSTAEARFLDETVRLQPIDGNMIGLIPVSYSAKPGDYPLTIEFQSGDEKTVQEFPITVVNRKFREDHIRVSEKMREQTLNPKNRLSDAEKTVGARQKALANPTPPMWSGRFIWPVTGRITTNFGYARFVNDRPNGRHSGLDIAAPTGRPILATNHGQVVLAEDLHWTGKTILIYHGMNLFSSYSHLSSMMVRPGDSVRKGDRIGYVGATGLATGPHLHFTIRLGETAVDPYLFLDKNVAWEGQFFHLSK